MRSVWLALAVCSLPVAGWAQDMRWVTYQDPRENGFTAEVPEGWAVAGGTIRPTPGDPRTVMEMRSPNGRVEIGLNDKDLPNFIIPSPMYSQMGVREGTPVGNGVIQSRYLDALAFGNEYGQRAFGRSCGHPLEMLTQQRDDQYGAQMAQATGIPGATGSSGIVALQCKDQQHGFYGIVYSVTVQMPFPTGGGYWQALPIMRIAVVDQADAEAAMRIASQFIAGIKVNPQWRAAEEQAQRQTMAAQAAATARGPSGGSPGQTPASIMHDLSDYRRKVMNHAYAGRQEANDRVQRNVIDTIRGDQRLVDPTTGRGYVAPYGYNSYSVGPNGTVYGTMGGGVPGTTGLQRNNN